MNEAQSDELSVLQSIYDTDYAQHGSVERNELPAHIVDNITQCNDKFNVITIIVLHKPLIHIKYFVPQIYPTCQLYYTLIYTNTINSSVIDLYNDTAVAQQLHIDIEYIQHQINDIQQSLVDHVRIYDITEFVKQYLAGLQFDINPEHNNMDTVDTETINNNDRQPVDHTAVKQYKIHTGTAITENKSTFQAHCCTINNAADVLHILNQLLQNNKIQRATHNIYAYIVTPNSTVISDCSDDRETGAGRILLELLYKLQCNNVIVIVTRWYGGIHLGSQRFTLIKQTANAVLREFGYVPSVK